MKCLFVGEGERSKVPARRLEIKFWKGSATEEKIVLGGNVVDRWLKKKNENKRVMGQRGALIQ